MMKALLILIFICGLTSVFAQPGKTRKKTLKPKPPTRQKRAVKLVPPPPLLERFPASKTLSDKKAIERILGKDVDYFLYKRKETMYFTPAFLWKVDINEDTTLAPETLYKQYVEFHSSGASDASIWHYLTSEPTEIKKGSDKENSVFPLISSYDDFSLTIEKNILILTNKKNKEVEKFKVFLDKEKEKILKIQNLKDNRIYEPSEPHPIYPSIAVPSRGNKE